ncbi:hypothetical protein Sjap_011172 [Stephania japonica]|uniref:Uncharacterized protein n=1 Tax=Stephania japonica TaxID=461633 RepID=A0AAP0JBW9_9MAGN
MEKMCLAKGMRARRSKEAYEKFINNYSKRDTKIPCLVNFSLSKEAMDSNSTKPPKKWIPKAAPSTTKAEENSENDKGEDEHDDGNGEDDENESKDGSEEVKIKGKRRKMMRGKTRKKVIMMEKTRRVTKKKMMIREKMKGQIMRENIMERVKVGNDDAEEGNDDEEQNAIVGGEDLDKLEHEEGEEDD